MNPVMCYLLRRFYLSGNIGLIGRIVMSGHNNLLSHCQEKLTPCGRNQTPELGLWLT